MDNNILDMPIVCSNCKGKIWDEAIYKTDSVLGIIGECCSDKWGDIQVVSDTEFKNKEYKMKTVKDLIKELEKFNQEAPVIFRKGHGDGYFSDHELEGPNDFYPHGCAVFSIGTQVVNDK